jgi:ribosomal protein L18
LQPITPKYKTVKVRNKRQITTTLVAEATATTIIIQIIENNKTIQIYTYRTISNNTLLGWYLKITPNILNTYELILIFKMLMGSTWKL